jgi:hypothetical protein
MNMRPLPSDRSHSPRAGRSPLSSLPSRDRRSVLELPEPDRRGARAPRQADYLGNPSTPRASGPRLVSPVLTVRCPETKPASVSPPEGVVTSSLHEVAPGLTHPRPSSLRPSPAFASRVAPSTSGLCSACGLGTIPRRFRLAIALSFHGFLVPLQGTPGSSLHAHRGR